MENEVLDECANCGVSLVGKLIPVGDRHLFGSDMYYSRRVAVYSRELDRTVAWRCPDCGYQWDR